MHKHWENPEVTGYGRLPAHADFHREGADDLSLEGTWQFRRINHPDADDNWLLGQGEDWLDVQAPGLWTLDPRVPDDNPIYTNILMPFKAEPPGIPDNPTGLYRRQVTVPADWLNDRVVICLGGVENAFYLYCNGIEVGFSKDARLPSEFELTPWLRAGDNLIALKVLKYCDASYIENQDQWWHAGIHRTLYLYRTPRVYIRDVFARPTYQPDTGEGALGLTVRLGVRTGRRSITWWKQGSIPPKARPSTANPCRLLSATCTMLP